MNLGLLPAGINFFGASYTSLFVNNNGNITFDGPLSAFTPQSITGLSNPMIAAFWADVDTNALTPLTPTAGGTSPGSTLVYDARDAANGVFPATWDDVGYFFQSLDKKNAFQIQLVDRGDGDFDIIYRYEAGNWTSGDVESPTDDGPGGTVARAGPAAGRRPPR